MVSEELVLDTTYLLPVFGISVGLEGFSELFPRLLARELGTSLAPSFGRANTAKSPAKTPSPECPH